MARLGEPIHYDPNSILLEAERGNVMKSIEIESHLQVGISNGLSSPIDR